jgi:hypothetical protein
MNEMLERMQTLRSQLHRLTILCMTADPTCSECSMIANRQSAKMRQLQAATDAFTQLYGMQPATGATKDVPIELPYFQWKDHVFRKRTAIFASPNACLKHFDNVLLSHVINLKANWKRLIPSKLSNSMSTWFEKLLFDKPTINWSEFKIQLNESMAYPMMRKRR